MERKPKESAWSSLNIEYYVDWVPFVYIETVLLIGFARSRRRRLHPTCYREYFRYPHLCNVPFYILPMFSPGDGFCLSSDLKEVQFT